MCQVVYIHHLLYFVFLMFLNDIVHMIRQCVGIVSTKEDNTKEGDSYAIIGFKTTFISLSH